MMAFYNTAILHLANYYLEHRDDGSGYHADGAIYMIHVIYGVRVERVSADMFKIADLLMED
jgi:hypothetical protein